MALSASRSMGCCGCIRDVSALGEGGGASRRAAFLGAVVQRSKQCSERASGLGKNRYVLLQSG
jgi:hypothetical protein